MRVSVPVASDPAGMLMVALPLCKVVAEEVKPPPVSVTVPVGAGLPLTRLTATVAVNPCAVVMLDEGSVTATAGVALFTVNVPFTVFTE